MWERKAYGGGNFHGCWEKPDLSISFLASVESEDFETDNPKRSQEQTLLRCPRGCQMMKFFYSNPPRDNNTNLLPEKLIIVHLVTGLGKD